MRYAILILALSLPAAADAQCSGGSCRAGVRAAPVRLVKQRVANRPLLKRLFGR